MSDFLRYLKPNEQKLLAALVELQVISSEKQEELVRESRTHGSPSVGHYLVKSGFLRSHELDIVLRIADKRLTIAEGQALLMADYDQKSRLQIQRPSAMELFGPKILDDETSTSSEFEHLDDDTYSGDFAEEKRRDATASMVGPPKMDVPPELAEWLQNNRRRTVAAGSAIADTLVESERHYRADVPLSGTRLGKYLLLRPIGRGGTSWVFLASHQTVKTTVALKVLYPSLAVDEAGFLDRFRREALLLMKLNHPAIVRVSDFDFINNYYIMAMDYVDGLSVADLIRVSGRMAEMTSLKIAIEVVEALRSAYKLFIVHRDIKPSNLIMKGNGEVRLTDFGLARWMSDTARNDMTRPQSGLGTPYYCAPEQSEDAGSVDFRADIYSLGASLYHMLTGRPPFGGKTRDQVLRHHARSNPAHPKLINTDLSEQTSQLILEMLEKSPSRRPASHLELLSRLHACLHSLREIQEDTRDLSGGDTRPERAMSEFRE